MEGFGQRVGSGLGVARDLQVGEEALELVRDAVVFRTVQLGVVGEGKDTLTELWCHEQSL